MNGKMCEYLSANVQEVPFACLSGIGKPSSLGNGFFADKEEPGAQCGTPCLPEFFFRCHRQRTFALQASAHKVPDVLLMGGDIFEVDFVLALERFKSLICAGAYGKHPVGKVVENISDIHEFHRKPEHPAAQGASHDEQ